MAHAGKRRPLYRTGSYGELLHEADEAFTLGAADGTACGVKDYVTAPAVFKDGKVSLVNEDGYRAAVAKAGWGDGEALIVRVETEADAAKWQHFKFFYGYVVEPMVQFTGDVDIAFDLKTRFLKEPYTSLTQQTADEFAEFNAKCDAYCRLHLPEAFDLYGREWLGPGQGCIKRQPNTRVA